MKKPPKIVKNIQNHELLKTDYNNQTSISYSQMSTYQTCPLKWKLNYKDGRYEHENNINTIFGTSIHESIQIYLELMYSKSAAYANRFDLNLYFEEKLSSLYKEKFKQNKNIHFSSPEELREYFEDGVQILEYLKKKRSIYFPSRQMWLVGVEIPINIQPLEEYYGIMFKGYIDIVLYDEKNDIFRIIDIKTSKNSWNQKQKSDELKQNQLILYKKKFSEQFNIPLEKIEIEFLIVKRKLYEESDFAQKRFQLYSPPSGKIKLKKAYNMLENFIKECFNNDGKYIEKEYTPNPGNHCRWCPYNNSLLCTKNIDNG
jgi:hypothetical protein